MKDKLQNLEGLVVDVKRKGFGPIITIEDNQGEKYKVSLPVKLNDNFELIPYELASLVNQTVKFVETKEELHDCGLTGYTTINYNYELQILSGPLKGRKYNAIKS